MAFACNEPDERATSACKALMQATRYHQSLGVRFERVLKDNGACYRSRPFSRLIRRLGLRHMRTRPCTPRTNGKAEGLVQTSLREWAYTRSYTDSQQRNAALRPWLHHDNWHRPHASLAHNPPIRRISLINVLGLHIQTTISKRMYQRMATITFMSLNSPSNGHHASTTVAVRNPLDRNASSKSHPK